MKYIDILAQAWKEHLKSKDANAPTVISTFTGCGGSSLGYSMAGYRELLAVEWDDKAVETFRLNFPDVPIYHDDIHQLSVEECKELANIQEGELDVLDGSPPCQGFSDVGKRRFDDTRNQLYHEYVRLLRGLKPKAFVMENVFGMVRGKMKLIFADIMRELKASGYRVKCRLLNAKFFNVPQNRPRLIFIGLRDDLEIEPSHPKPQTLIPFTVRDAWEGVTVDDYGRELTERMQRFYWASKEGEYFNKAASKLLDKKKRSYFSSSRLSYSESSFCITAFGHNDIGVICHPVEARRISLAEAKRIASFPDGFQFSGTFRDAWEQIGNSVPPLFMKAVAEHVRALLL
jgi:DNA (cytosine-5)-methyltransferase 1